MSLSLERYSAIALRIILALLADGCMLLIFAISLFCFYQGKLLAALMALPIVFTCHMTANMIMRQIVDLTTSQSEPSHLS